MEPDQIPPYSVPRDSEGYIQSFAVSEVQEFSAFFETYGFVVIRDVISQEECDKSINEIWDYIESGDFRRPSSQKFRFEVPMETSFPKRTDKTTWNKNWPDMAEEGIVGTPPVFKKQLLQNRQNPNIYKVFSSLMKEQELIVNHDRVGLFRPTKSSGTEGGQDAPHWKTTQNLHFDMNPWRFFSPNPAEFQNLEDKIQSRLANLGYNHLNDFIFENNELGPSVGKVHLQAVLNFYPNKKEDGGFQLVPGFSRHAHEWVEKTKEKLGRRYMPSQTFIVLPDSCSLQKQSIRVTMRPGSLVVWDQTTAHGSVPNNSSNPRYCQFLKMHLASNFYKQSDEKGKELNERCVRRRERIKTEMERNGEFQETDLTELGRKLFGFEPW